MCAKWQLRAIDFIKEQSSSLIGTFEYEPTAFQQHLSPQSGQGNRACVKCTDMLLTVEVSLNFGIAKTQAGC